MTQGETFEELLENLRDIYQEIISQNIPTIRHVGELVIS
jgi:predicted RNase H-like HicB family nuclease